MQPIRQFGVELESSTKLIDISSRSSNHDLSIRYCCENNSKLTAIQLMRPEIVLIAHPEIVADLNSKQVAQALGTLNLLREKDLKEWRYWLGRFSVAESEVKWGATLEDDTGLIEAALAGQGIASVRRHYVEQQISGGKLACLAVRKRPDRAYYLVGRPDRMQSRSAVAFRRWLVGEASSTDASPA